MDLISNLKELLSGHRFDEKILITSDFETGNQILQTLAGDPGWINFRSATVLSLASETAKAGLIEEGIKEISLLETNIIIDGIFSGLSEEGNLYYFKKYTVNTGIISAITDVIFELKMSSVSPGDLESRYFIDEKKAYDLKTIFYRYQQILTEKRLADAPDIIKAACRILEESPEDKRKKYMVISGDRRTPLEEEFVNRISSGNLLILPRRKIYGLKDPEGRWEYKGIYRPGKGERSAWLFDIGKIPVDAKRNRLELFCGANFRNEIEEVLNRICSSQIPLDSVELIYSESRPYLITIFNICTRIGLPATFAEGLPGDMSRAGTALKAFIQWISDGFYEIHLRRLLKYSLIKVPAKKGPLLSHILRTSKIGWGRQRYGAVLSSRIKSMEDNSGKDNRGRLEDLKLLKDISMRLLKIVPEVEEDGKIYFSGLCRSCIDFIEGFLQREDEDNARYTAVLKQRLELLPEIADKSVLLEEAAAKLIDIIEKTPFKKSAPRPGHLHVSSIYSGGISGRACTFIVGLDSHRFPGAHAQNPVLLDRERKNIGKNLKLSEDILREKLYDFTTILASLEGSITASYSAYDIEDGRYLFPSSVFLQLYRLRQETSDIDYSGLLKYLGRPHGYGSPKNIDQTGWWIDSLVGGGKLKDGKSSIFNIYPWLKQGEIAILARKSNQLTVYDGYVRPEEEELDPRKNRDMVLSCSGLETYAESPYRFFLEYILGARRPEEVERDPLRWLDPAQRGILLHEVFQAFAFWLKEEKEMPDIKRQREVIEDILDRMVERHKEIVPVSGSTAYVSEVGSLKRDIEVFLDVNSKLEFPYLVEYEFGYGENKPVYICIADGSCIRIKGKIDRIDIDRDGSLNVWDYKTGSAYSFESDGYIDRGRQIQHVLYARVAEKVLGKPCKVCGYILPTEKGISSGKGPVFKRDPGDNKRWQEGLSLMLDLITEGIFIISDEQNPPYIDDTDIYGKDEDKLAVRAKLKNEANIKLSKWKRLKDYK